MAILERTKMEIDNKKLVAIILVVVLSFTAVNNWDTIMGLFNPPPPPVDEVAEQSTFKFTGVRLDATTSVTGASVRSWYDANDDDVMQYSELGTFTEASGVYTSDKEYPIDFVDTDGVLHSFDIHVQSVVATYQVTYGLFHMTGVAASDLSAKSVGNLEHMLTEDSMTYDGVANGAAWDTTDYNYTLSGTSGTHLTSILFATADSGVTSQEWPDVDYETAYGIDKQLGYYIDWANIYEGSNDEIAVGANSIMAATFFSHWCTIADWAEGAIQTTTFDTVVNNGVNKFGIKQVDTSFGDMFYNTADPSAPIAYFSFTYGVISAAGTFGATYGSTLWQGCTYDAMMGGTWTQGTALALGTAGDGWAWAA